MIISEKAGKRLFVQQIKRLVIYVDCVTDYNLQL